MTDCLSATSAKLFCYRSLHDQKHGSKKGVLSVPFEASLSFYSQFMLRNDELSIFSQPFFLRKGSSNLWELWDHSGMLKNRQRTLSKTENILSFVKSSSYRMSSQKKMGWRARILIVRLSMAQCQSKCSAFFWGP